MDVSEPPHTIRPCEPRIHVTMSVKTLVRETGDGDQPDPIPFFGPAEGELRVTRDGRTITTARFHAVIDGERVEGFLFGHVAAVPDDPTLEAGELFGHFAAHVTPTGDLIAGTFGGPDATPTDAAVVFSGHCPGPAVSGP